MKSTNESNGLMKRKNETPIPTSASKNFTLDFLCVDGFEYLDLKCDSMTVRMSLLVYLIFKPENGIRLKTAGKL